MLNVPTQSSSQSRINLGEQAADAVGQPGGIADHVVAEAWSSEGFVAGIAAVWYGGDNTPGSSVRQRSQSYQAGRPSSPTVSVELHQGTRLRPRRCA